MTPRPVREVSFALAELAAALANNVASAQGDSMTQSAMQQLSGSKKACLPNSRSMNEKRINIPEANSLKGNWLATS
eukprot:353600-Amphidinium_carterae.1